MLLITCVTAGVLATLYSCSQLPQVSYHVKPLPSLSASRLCDNGKTYISIMDCKTILITIIISINNDTSCFGFYYSKIANTSVCFV